MAKKKVMNVTGFTFFKLMKEYDLDLIEFGIYTYLLGRLQYTNKLCFEGKLNDENFSIDSQGFGRVPLTYNEVTKELKVSRQKFKRVIDKLEAKELLYFEQIESGKMYKVNVFCPVVPKGILDWESWSFRVFLNMDGEFIETTDKPSEFTVTDALNYENGFEELKPKRKKPVIAI